MKSANELTQLGKDISNSYINDSKDLTKSLIKVAYDFNLNKQEISRVAETANIETYLKMLNIKDDKYIEFPLANAEEACDEVVKVAGIYNKGEEDYFEDLPDSKEFSFSLFGVDPQIEEKKNDLAAIIKQADYLNGSLEHLSNDLGNEVVDLETSYKNIYNFIKQSMLSKEVNFSDASLFIKQASLNYSDYLIESLNNDLIKIMPDENFTKESSLNENFEINKDSKLYNYIINFEEKLEKIAKMIETANGKEKEFDKLVKENSLYITKKALYGKLLAGAALAGIAGLGATIVKKELGQKAGKKLNANTAIAANIQEKQLR